MKYYYWQNDILFLRVYIQPRASKNEIVGLYNEQLKIRLTAPALENKANEALIKFLAKELKIANKSVEIVNGEHSRSKLVKIVGLDHNVDIPKL